MAQTLALDDPALHRAKSEIDAVHADLSGEQRALCRVVQTLLDGGWAGVASVEFADGWSDWQAGCEQVLRSLAAMRELLSAVQGELHLTDDDRAVCIGNLRHRLGAVS